MPPKSRRDWSKPPMRAYEPGKRHMELIPSVSRSSGLDNDGDALKDYQVQEDYRGFIQTKLSEYWDRFPYDSDTQDMKQREEVQGNLLILFRKLREGLLSTKRADAFALEVYETSLHLSIIFHSPVQTTSITSHLLPSMYRALPAHYPTIIPTILLSSLHFLVSEYPSQSRYFENLHSLPTSFFPDNHNARIWLRDVARMLRLRNYSRLESLTSRDFCERVLQQPGYSNPKSTGKYSFAIDLVLEALCSSVEALRAKVREANWLVLRSAYRELSLVKPSDADSAPTRDWLCRCLALRSVKRKAGLGVVDAMVLVDLWMESRRTLGDVRQKEGAESRWIIVKPKA
ncbi:hypothetical protein BC835DRAFT_1354502 [Cytidiella melzeri]|nr:hypothetical protein BC835DRAFT_1354502 [Cytidiella melzeri]